MKNPPSFRAMLTATGAYACPKFETHKGIKGETLLAYRLKE